jgi:non-heme chloroperoxidase
MSVITTDDDYVDLLQGLRHRSANCIPPRLAPEPRTTGMPRRCSCLRKGYRVVAHGRRGHGRSSQPTNGHQMDTNAKRAAAVADHLDLRDAVHIGHSTGGGEVARRGAGRVAKAVLISAVPLLLLKTESNPFGPSMEVFDGFRQGTGLSRAPDLSRFRARPVRWVQPARRERGGGRRFELVASRDDGSSQRRLQRRQSVLGNRSGRRPASYRCPTLVMRGDDDRIVPIADSAKLSIRLLEHGTLKAFPATCMECVPRMRTLSTRTS